MKNTAPTVIPKHSMLRLKIFMISGIVFLLFHPGTHAGNRLPRTGNKGAGAESQAMSPEGVSGRETFPFISSLSVSPSSRQQTPTRRSRRQLYRDQVVGIGINMLGPTMGYGSICTHFSFNRLIQVEAGIDMTTVYGGLNFYPLALTSTDPVSPYMGLMIGYGENRRDAEEKDAYMYMPVGLRYTSDKNWFIAGELAATTADNINTSPLFIGLKLGYLFK